MDLQNSLEAEMNATSNNNGSLRNLRNRLEGAIEQLPIWSAQACADRRLGNRQIDVVTASKGLGWSLSIYRRS